MAAAGTGSPGWIGPMLVILGGLLFRLVIVFSSDRL